MSRLGERQVHEELSEGSFWIDASSELTTVGRNKADFMSAPPVVGFPGIKDVAVCQKMDLVSVLGLACI